MKVSLNVICGLALLLCGDLMAEQHPHDWVTITDDKTGLKADFPQRPLEMTFDVPFQNTPPTGQMHLYSVPTKTGILILSTFTSDQVTANWVKKEQLYQFFETILVPHLFFNPAVFQDQQIFTYQSTKINGEKAASYQISYQDHDVIKQLEGVAMVRDKTFYTYFYLASEKAFDQEIFKRFLSSVQLAQDE